MEINPLNFNTSGLSQAFG